MSVAAAAFVDKVIFKLREDITNVTTNTLQYRLYKIS